MINDDEGLTPAEIAAFATLPRVSASDQLAEQRIVQALRERGLLRASRDGGGRRAGGLATRIAAALILFVAGTLFGKSLAARETHSASPAMDVQQAGTAYVNALVRLSSAKDTERQPGFEAANATLRAAATSLALINPGDAVSARIQQSLSADTSVPSDHSIIWF